MLALFALAWHVFQSAPEAPPQVAAAPPRPLPRSPVAPSPPPPKPTPSKASPTPKPALATDAAFWSGQLSRINRDDSALQKAEWGLVQALTRAARDYLEKVVLPAIKRAEGQSLNSS